MSLAGVYFRLGDEFFMDGDPVHITDVQFALTTHLGLDPLHWETWIEFSNSTSLRLDIFQQMVIQGRISKEACE